MFTSDTEDDHYESDAELPDLNFENKAVIWNPLDFDDFQMDEVYVPEDIDITRGAVPHKSMRPLREDEIGDNSPFSILGFEVGDDRADFHRKSRLLSLLFVFQESVFGMITSSEDTFISRTCFNLAEVTTMIPRSMLGGYHASRGSGTFENLEFNDVVPLRVVIDVSKQRGDHSSSIVGKASLIGTKSQSPRLADGILNTIFLCGWFQDGALKTTKSSEPKYIHRVIGGSGVRALWDNPSNIYTYMRCYKGGSYHRIYGTAVEEVRTALRELTAGRPYALRLCGVLRRKQEYLHGTYGPFVVIPNKKLARDHGVLPDPLYKGEELDGLLRCAEHRLIRSRRIVRRPEAEVEYERFRKLELLLSTADSVASCMIHTRAARERVAALFNGALTANTAFQNLLQRKANGDEIPRLFREGYDLIRNGQTGFHFRDAEFLAQAKPLRNSDYTLYDLVPVEDIFLQDEVSVASSLKVEGILLETMMANQVKHQITSSRLGLYQISEAEEEWADNTVEELRATRDANEGILPIERVREIYLRSTEWVNDDDPIMYQIQTHSRTESFPRPVLVVTNDGKLCQRAADMYNIIVYRLPTDLFVPVYIMNTGAGVVREEDLKGYSLSRLLIDFGDYIRMVYRWVTPGLLLFDTGALRETAKNLAIDEGNITKVLHPYKCRFKSNFKRSERLQISNHEVIRDRLSFYLPHATDSGMRRFTKADKPKYIDPANLRGLTPDERHFVHQSLRDERRIARAHNTTESLIAHCEYAMADISSRVSDILPKRTPPKQESFFEKVISSCWNLKKSHNSPSESDSSFSS